MKNLGQARWILGICAVVAGCGGATPAPEVARSGAEISEAGAPSAADKTSKPSPSAASAPASAQKSQAPDPVSPAASSSPESVKGEPSPEARAFPDLAESPGAREIEPAADLLRKEQWVAAQVRLSKLFPVFDTSGPVDAVIAAHVLYGRSCAKMKDARCAEREHKRAIELWEAPGTAAALPVKGDNDVAGRERLTRALVAVGEAHFFMAELKRAELNQLRSPEYKGPATKEAVARYIETKVADWVKKKTALVEETEKAYAKIFDLKPAPPARWAVAAAARSATSWGRFTAEFRAAPIPAEWKGQGKIAGSALTAPEMRQFYYESLDKAAEPLKARAHAAFERCRDASDRTQHRDDFSHNCVTWLEKFAGAPPATDQAFTRPPAPR